MKKPTELSPKQKRFVEEYLVDMNACQAFLRSGYSHKDVSHASQELMSKPLIRAAIQARLDARSEKLGMSAEWVVEKLRREAQLSDDDGGTHAGRIRALELLGKHLGMFSERFEARLTLHRSVKDMTTDELLEIVQRGRELINQHGIAGLLPAPELVPTQVTQDR